MSRQNRISEKRFRHGERAARKAAASKSIPYHGVVVSKKDVIGQRYNAVHGLPFSRTVAAVHIEAAVKGSEE